MPNSEDPHTPGSTTATDDAAAEQAADAPRTPRAWITIALLIGSVAASLAGFAQPERVFDILYATGQEIWIEWKWWGMFSANLLHADFIHLAFNGVWLLRFGRALEHGLGRMRFLLFTVAAAWVSSAAELSWSGAPGIGLSGIVYAYFGYLVVNRRADHAYALALTKPIAVLFFVWLVACFALTYTGVLPVANFAHLGGLVVGLLCGRARDARPDAGMARVTLAAVAVLSFVPLFWLPSSMPWLQARAYRALVDGHYSAAVDLLEPALQRNPDDAATHYYLSLAYAQLKNDTAAKRSLIQVIRLSDTPVLLNNAAWMLATAMADGIRDGRQALAGATRACELDGYKTAGHIDTLAAAHAEVGDFVAAEKWIQAALEKSEGEELRAELARHAEAFRAGKPWREPIETAAGSP